MEMRNTHKTRHSVLILYSLGRNRSANLDRDDKRRKGAPISKKSPFIWAMGIAQIEIEGLSNPSKKVAQTIMASILTPTKSSKVF